VGAVIRSQARQQSVKKGSHEYLVALTVEPRAPATAELILWGPKHAVDGYFVGGAEQGPVRAEILRAKETEKGR
jgi:hypothetical protein